MSHPPQFDPSIPVLTEVFQEQAPKPAAADDDGALEQRAIDGWSEPEWTLLERRLSARLLQQLQSRVDFVLEQRLRDSLEDVVEHALAGLTADIRQGLHQTIEQIVVRAVAQELAHLQALKT